MTLNVPDDLLEEVQQKLAPYHRTVEDYLIGVLYDLADENESAEPLSVEEEAMIEAGLRSPPVVVDETFWRRLRERAEQFRRRTGT